MMMTMIGVMVNAAMVVMVRVPLAVVRAAHHVPANMMVVLPGQQMQSMTEQADGAIKGQQSDRYELSVIGPHGASLHVRSQISRHYCRGHGNFAASMVFSDSSSGKPLRSSRNHQAI
jgi:hypothetical protein